MSTKYSISHQAYVKLALHAAKYPHKQVTGVFIGKSTGPSAVDIVDAIPLLHLQTNLRLCMEIGLALARNHAQSIGLELVGYYQASGDLDNTSLTPAGERVAEALKAGFAQAAAFVVINEKLSTGEPALLPYLPQGSLWKIAQEADVQPFTSGSQFALKNTSSPPRVLELIRNDRLHEKLGDFDDNLEDVSIDWLKNELCNDSSF
ncbi:UPF0172-domain-containing protein [Schizopora paradoxa]|uniref:UPF0172-domain-containing protein n=1 Tax=Schizopora paradoxa TaxID=27342 RepID=A0A0H2SIE9_9AGAM|nr:UPF0172-domain-containing protein [Schizopora paradoxa]